jgi:hypothetical protein
MFLSAGMKTSSHWLRSLSFLVAMCVLWTSFGTTWAQSSVQGGGASPPASSGPQITIATSLCQPSTCFANVAARQQYAQDNSCYFLEDVCTKTPPSQDNKGAKPEDQDFWGGLWDSVSGGLQYGYEFVKGLYAGLKDQITDLFDLITNPGEVIDGMIALGKAFYDDPEGTLAALAELLGQEAIDTITRATQCGAHDLGRVIGQYVSPTVALKLAGKLSKYSGDLRAAVRATKHDLGCASFVAGTPVLTPAGLLNIERVAQNDDVLSRDDRLWSDAPQKVTKTFGREAPSYRELRTELETYRLTDEHPLWVQGKGWTEAKDITDDDVLASLKGDVRVQANKAIQRPVRVYNFSVEKTPSYFVGDQGLWAHNAKCDIVPGGGLSAHEGPRGTGGHTLERHVNVSTQDIIDRANGRPPWPSSPPLFSSRYRDRSTAEFAIAETLAQATNQQRIVGWLSSPPSPGTRTLELRHSFPNSIGESVARNSSVATPAANAVVVLVRDSSRPSGYFILTSFPEL